MLHNFNLELIFLVNCADKILFHMVDAVFWLSFDNDIEETLIFC